MLLQTCMTFFPLEHKISYFEQLNNPIAFIIWDEKKNFSVINICD